jgi:hypothetical protein
MPKPFLWTNFCSLWLKNPFDVNLSFVMPSGDTEMLEQLKTQKSPRQRAKEQAEAARESGANEVADQWESEVVFDIFQLYRC